LPLRAQTPTVRGWTLRISAAAAGRSQLVSGVSKVSVLA
jgi:hypothetical protein